MIEKKFQKFTIKTQLIISFSALTVGIVLLITLLTAMIERKTMLDTHSKECTTLAENISRDIDYQLKNMDSAKRQFLYSADNMIDLYDYLSSADPADRSQSFSELSHKLYGILANGIPQMHMLCLYGGDKSSITAQSSRNYSLIPAEELSRLGLYDDTFVCGTQILPPRTTKGGLIISMVSLFTPPKDEKLRVILEIQQRYSVFSDTIEQDVADSGRIVYLYDTEGNVIYPQSGDVRIPDGYIENDADSFMSKTGDIVARSSSSYSNWTVLVIEQESIYGNMARSTLKRAVFTGILAVLFSVALIVLISKRLTQPLSLLQKEIYETAIDTLSEKTGVDKADSNNEYDQLRYSFTEMRLKLNDSVQEYIQAKQEQSRTQMLALWSRVHPHFVNNVLASISILIKHGETEKAISICRDLSSMLNYTITDFDREVTLKDELEYADSYVRLMMIRHGDRIVYEDHVSEELNGIPVPKMIVQPLIENSIKHGMTGDPIHIGVFADVTDDRFRITVKDDGAGFDNVSSAEKTKGSHSESGIGLDNIRKRLELVYGTNAVMEIKSRPGETSVTIGGTYRR